MKKLSFALTLLILLQACSQKQSQTSSRSQVQVKSSQVESHGIDALERLVFSETPNIALAEMVARTIPDSEIQVSKLLLSLTPEDARKIINNLKIKTSSVRQMYLFQGQAYTGDKDLLKGSGDYKTGLNLAEELKLTTFSYIKNQSLNEIIETYSREASQLTVELSGQIARELGRTDLETAARLEKLAVNSTKQEFVAAVVKLQPYLEKIDKHFKRSNLNEKEQMTTLVAGAIAGGLYLHLQKYKTFRNIEREVRATVKKVEELGVILTALDEHATDTAKNMTNLKEGVDSFKKDLSDLRSASNGSVLDGQRIEPKKIYRFIKNELILNKKKNKEESNPSLLSRRSRMAESVAKTAGAVSNLAGNLSTIIETTNRLSSLVGIKPSNDLLKVMNKAQEVSSIVGSIASVAAGYATGGPLAAMSALSSSPMMGMLGKGNTQSYAAEFAMINRKLDLILENQKKTIELQLETMKLIKELAVMVDDYHQKEMAAIVGLRDQQIVILENQRSLVHRDILNCERLIDFQLKTQRSSNLTLEGKSASVTYLNVTSSQFYKGINSIENLRKVIASTNERAFEDCQAAVATAFGPLETDTSILLATYSGKENDNIESFERDVYRPLLQGLKFYANKENLSTAPLHFPSPTVSSVSNKTAYVKSSIQTNKQVYFLDKLISSATVERYLQSLLILYPLLELDKDDWFKGIPEVVDSFLEKALYQDSHRIRSQYFFTNALKAVQSAIAQEAILAGEPLLDFIYEQRHKILSSSSCVVSDSSLPDTDMSFICAIRNNPLIMKNLMTYLLHKNSKIDTMFDLGFSSALSKKDPIKLSSLISESLAPESISFDQQGAFIELPSVNSVGSKTKIVVRVPSVEEYLDGQLMYSEKLPKLLQMQESILDALEKVTPVEQNDPKGVMKLLLLKKSS